MIILRVFLAIVTAVCIASSSQAIAADLVHVRLKDRLDRPQDGYCLDIPGTASSMQLDLPLFAHNCKNGPTADSTITFKDNGHLVFPDARVCATAFGVNNSVLPGTSVLLRPCNHRSPFFDTSNLQKYDYLNNGQLQLRGYNLCLAVGEESSRTFSPDDRWRVLSLQSCTDIGLTHSSWEMVPL